MPILTVTRYEVRPDAIAAWEEDVQRLSERAREKEDATRWRTSQVAAGRLGAYYVALQSDTVEEAAGRDPAPILFQRLFGEKEGAKMAARAAGCLTQAETQVLRDRPDLSYPPEEGREAIAFVITRMTVRGGRQDAAEELIRKVAEAVPKAGEDRRFTVLQPLLGDMREIAAVRPIYQLSELDDAAPVSDLLGRAFGASEGGLIFRAGTEALESLQSELALVRPDLSHPEG